MPPTNTPPVGGTGYVNGKPVASTVLPGSYDYTPPAKGTSQTIVEPTNKIVVTGGPATSKFNANTANLTTMLNGLNGDGTGKLPGSDITVGNTNDAYTQMLDKMSAGADAATKALIATIQSQRSQKGQTLDAQYDNYKRGLQLLGIQHNAAQATPDLLMGHIQEAENEHQQKLNALDVETNKALMDAENAKNTRDFETLDKKMAYVDKLKKEKQDYLKNIADQMNAASSIADNTVKGAYDQLTKLNPADQEKYLQAVASKYGISLGALTAAMVKEKNSREDRALDVEGKRSVISNRNKTSSSASVKYTPAELKKLRAAGIDSTNTKLGDKYLYGPDKGVAPVKFNQAAIDDGTIDKGEAWDLALALGIPRNVNLTKNDEIQKLFDDPKLSSYVQAMLDNGYTIQDIIDAQ